MTEQFSQGHRLVAHFGIRGCLCLGLLASLISGCEGENFTAATVGSDLAAANPSPVAVKPRYVRPKVADNGAPFPQQSGYIKNYPVRFADGYSSVTVDNSKNNSDVFVKLFALDSKPEQPVRVFFIRARESFTAKNVRAGRYDVRYRDLDSGGLVRTEKFDLREIKTDTNIQFSQIRLTLYKVAGGNMKTFDLAESEF